MSRCYSASPGQLRIVIFVAVFVIIGILTVVTSSRLGSSHSQPQTDPITLEQVFEILRSKRGTKNYKNQTLIREIVDAHRGVDFALEDNPEDKTVKELIAAGATPRLLRAIRANYRGPTTPSQPNLTPFQPPGWSDKIVVSKTTGTITDSATLFTNDTLYVDWATINNGDGATASGFNVKLYVDGVERQTFPKFNPPLLNVNFYSFVQDYSIGTLSAGQHVIKIVVDTSGAIAEKNETDNEYTKLINVSPPPTPTPTPKPEPARAGEVVKNSIGMELVWIPPGSFMMGSTDAEVRAANEKVKLYYPNVSPKWFNDEKPQHNVTIPEAFYMGRYEVTQAQWRAVMNTNPPLFGGCDSCPVEQVSWNDAQEFIKRLNARRDGFIYSLPSEAEWEYACRAGTSGDYAGNLGAIAWYSENSGKASLGNLGDFGVVFPTPTPVPKPGSGGESVDFSAVFNRPEIIDKNPTHPVGQKQPNAFGLYDMLGNVAEWCEDVWHKNYKGAPSNGSAWLIGGKEKIVSRIFRGGGSHSNAYACRCAFRAALGEDQRTSLSFGERNIVSAHFGFRVVARTRVSRFPFEPMKNPFGP